MKNKALFIILFISITTCGQVIDFKNDKYWIESGIGIAQTTSSSKDADIAAEFAFNLIKGKSILKTRILAVSEFNILAGGNESSINIGALIGKHHSTKFFKASYLAGLGITTGQERGKKIGTTGGWLSFNRYEMNNFTSISIPIEVNLVLKPMKFIGIGLTLFGDINAKRSSYGLLLKLEVGKLR